MKCPTRANWLWGLAYLLAASYLVITMLNLRQETLQSMGTAQARAEWDRHRAAARAASSTQGPVQRQVPPSSEPPALVLMRDHFAVMLGAALVFGTALFIIMLVAVKGCLSRAGPLDGSQARPDDVARGP